MPFVSGDNPRARAVMAAVRRLRKGRGWSAQRLSDECAKAGHPVARSVLSNAETGYRSVVTVDELVTFAAALDVPAIDLLHADDTGQRGGLLTEAEHKAMALTGALADLMCSHVIGFGASRSGDVNELVALVHGIQRMVLSQAAARAYPDRYRLLGKTLEVSGG